MSKFNQKPIVNLKYTDFRSDGSIKHKDFLNGIGVVVFYMPACGYCQMMEDEYQKAAAKSVNKIPFGAIDGTLPKNKKIVSLFDVESYPTIKIVDKGFIDKDSEFKSPRVAKNLISFACDSVDKKEKKYMSGVCGL